MNTGVQRSGATPPAARTATTTAVGADPGNAFGQGKNMPRSRWRTRSRTSPRPPSPNCTTWRRRSSARWSCAARATCTSSCRARSAGDPPRDDTIRSPAWPRRAALFPVFEAVRRRGHRGAADPPQVPVDGVPAAAAALRAPVRRSAPHGHGRRASRRCRPEHPPLRTAERDRVPGMSTSHSRSRWTWGPAWPTTPAPGARERPVYVDRLPPCNDACPAGENIQAWLYAAEEGDYETGLAADHARQPVPRRDGPGLLPPVRDRVQPRQLDDAVGINSVERFLGDEAIKQGWPFAGPGAANRQASAGRRCRAVRTVGGVPPARLGHEVEIREAGPDAGGMMRFGIPTYRLPRDVLDAEIAAHRRPGRAARSWTRGHRHLER